jgi:uncharacterized protein YgiM (DUF1202 family)
MSEEVSTEKRSANTLLTVVLVVVGVFLVLLVGILLGRALAPEPQGPPINLPPPPSYEGPYAVAGDYVNVRSGPGTEFTSYGVAQPGSSAPIIGVRADGAWWQISVPASVSPDGQAWVSADYVQAHNAANVPVTSPEVEPYAE